ncbi:transposase [Kineosporia babensis]|uniref:transposase n=1 Tax=Kineosporia babensis TaxID=499548 RepID=UPI0038B35C81
MPYATDLTDDEWGLLEPVFGCGGSRGPAPQVDRRTMVNAILYRAKAGCPWRMIPSEFGELEHDLADLGALAGPGRVAAGDGYAASNAADGGRV